MIYRLYVANRDPDGLISPPLEEHLVMADDVREAVRLARAIEIDVEALGGNAVYLDDENGMLVWSLRRADMKP